MFLIFEIHQYRGFAITATPQQLMFTLFFVTFGGMACTMPDLIAEATRDTRISFTAFTFSKMCRDLVKLGKQQLVNDLSAALHEISQQKEAEAAKAAS